MKLTHFVIAAACLALLVPAWAQTTSAAPATSQEKPQPVSASQPLHIGPAQVFGSLRLRSESWDWFDAPGFNDRYDFFASVLRIGLRQVRPRYEWLVEAEQPTLLGLPNRAIAPAPQGQLGLGGTYFSVNGSNAAGIVAKQAYFKLKHIGENATWFQLGRFEFSDGTETNPIDPTLVVLHRDRISQRLIGPFGFTHVGRSFDGAAFSRTTASHNVYLFAARPTRGVYYVDGNAELDVDVLFGSYTKPLAYHGNGEVRLFALSYHDGRRVLKTDNRPLAVRAADHHNIRIETLGGDLVHAFQSGGHIVDVLAWGAWQGGSWGTQVQDAWAIDGELGYQPPEPKLRPWFRAGYWFGSGDTNPNDNRHETFFQALPTPRGYARFPFFNLMNNQDAFVQAYVRPGKKLVLRTDYHVLRLASSRDLWYAGGGAFEKTSFGYQGRPSNGRSDFAKLFDVSADYPITSHVAVTFYYGHAAGDSVIRAIYPRNSSGNFGYVELNWRF